MEKNEALALEIDKVVRNTKKDSWLGNLMKEREIVRAIYQVVSSRGIATTDVFEVVKAQESYR